VEENTKLKFVDVKRVIGEHLKTAINVANFSITFAKLEGNDWKVNVEYTEMNGLLTSWTNSAMFTIDANSGDVKLFERGRSWVS
jgi:hypothetical protein